MTTNGQKMLKKWSLGLVFGGASKMLKKWSREGFLFDDQKCFKNDQKMLRGEAPEHFLIILEAFLIIEEKPFAGQFFAHF